MNFININIIHASAIVAIRSLRSLRARSLNAALAVPGALSLSLSLHAT